MLKTPTLAAMNSASSAEIEQKYRRLNNIGGWLVFFISAIVYWITIEPTASFWDCSEFIAVDYKLQIGHPPGAPFLQLIAHLVSLFTFGDVHKVAPYINRLSATCSALTIMFLFWTITYFAKKIVQKSGELTNAKKYTILGCGLVGALAYTFTDSFWFSAVEGEVYAMSSCFTALVFWCITRWERSETYAEKWIILTFYLIGLSIGVHLLCLLTVPAVVFVYYFKKYPNGLQNVRLSKLLTFFSKSPKMQGAVIAGIVAVVLLGSIQAVIIPGIIQLAAYFEIFFVNKMHLPFESGTFIYGVTIVLLITIGLIITRRLNRPGWSTAILAFTVLLIGYSSFLILVIRANAKTPMDENDPSDAVSLHAYLGRQQYGDWPLIYGQYYNSPLDAHKPYIDGDPVYAKDEKAGRYVVTNDMKSSVPNYDPAFCTLFPRMWDGSEDHPQGYRNWGGIDFNTISYTDASGQSHSIDKPTFYDNLKFFTRYQVNFMFWRYFLWNFCGRQNDIQGNDDADVLHGNWITGIPFIDSFFAPQSDMPVELKDNKGRNPLYGLPLLLGILGLIYQYRKDKENTLVIAVFFFFTGLAIILYLNQTPYQPRERDYAYVGAFYAFAIWIGLGVLGVQEILEKLFKKVTEKKLAMGATIVSLIVPVVMAHAEWNDHDRSKRYTCKDMAIDYLQSCAPNAILFTNGDNDTFPLWYAQEVEGIRTDVRVCNLDLLTTPWYIDQMKRRVYNSAPFPISMTHEQYLDGRRDYTPVFNNKNVPYTDLKELINFAESDSSTHQLATENGKRINYFPTNKFELKTNKEELITSDAVPKNLQNQILPSIDWTIPGDYVYKNTLVVLDLLAHNDWKRPIYFTVTSGSDVFMGLDKYLQLEGMTYRLVPIMNDSSNSIQNVRVATDIMYNNVMHKFKWGNMSSGIYLDETIRGMAKDMRIEVLTLTEALIRENKKDSALKVLNVCIDSIPAAACPCDYSATTIVFGYYQLGRYSKGDTIAQEIFTSFENKIKYCHSLSPISIGYYKNDIGQMQVVLERLAYLAQKYARDKLYDSFKSKLDKLHSQGIL